MNSPTGNTEACIYCSKVRENPLCLLNLKLKQLLQIFWSIKWLVMTQGGLTPFFQFSLKNTLNTTHQTLAEKGTRWICFYRACAIRLHRDVSIGSWCAFLIRLVRIGTRQHTAEVGYFWLISTLHPHTSWHSCIRLRLPSREQAGEKDEQQRQQEKKSEAALWQPLGNGERW